MTKNLRGLGVFLLALLCGAMAVGKPLKVYILAGQSNMQGSAHQSTFAAMGDDPATAALLKEISDQDGKPVVSENAWVANRTQRGGEDLTQYGKVKVGYGFDDERVGPEYGFGVFMDRSLEEPVLIIKTAWGGKSLAVDFRPPSAGAYVPGEGEDDGPSEDEVGHYYREMVRFVRATMMNADAIRKVVPGYEAKDGFELSGFVWFQGWNDMCNRHHIEQYSENMIHFITDVRKEFSAPKLPFIVGVLGVYGTEPESRRFDKGLPVTDFRAEQFKAVKEYDSKVDPKYQGKVIAVDSGPFYELALSDLYWKRRMTENWKRQIKEGKMTEARYDAECAKFGFGDGELTAEERETWKLGASNAEYHYLGSGKTFVSFGKALAEAMLALEKE